MTALNAGDRVRVRPGTGSAGLVGDHSPTGTVSDIGSDDEDQVYASITLDDGAMWSGERLDDWELIA